MKKLNFLLALALVFTMICQSVQAKILRVGFSGVPAITGTDFPNLQAAHDAATAGDSIYIFPGTWSVIINKRCYFFGYGFSASVLDPGLQNIIGTVTVSASLNVGSSRSSFQGIDGLTIAINSADSVQINRCYIANIALTAQPSPIPPFKNWSITQSLINSLYIGRYNNAYIYCGLTSFNISNCWINSFSFAGSVSGSSSGILSNNIFVGTTNSTNFNNCLFSCSNNIFLCPNLPASTAAFFQNNVATTNIIPADGNKINVAAASIFVGYPTQGSYSDDNRFVLASGSPAKGAGDGGTDCGIFGGSNPYVLGGIPVIPSFYKLSAPSNTVSSNPYTITFSVKSNN